MKANKLIFSSWFELQSLVVNYLDVGARGDVSDPWSLFTPDTLQVIGFEPDPTEYDRLVKVYPKRKYYRNALWSEATTRLFYLCEWEATSSMYPPAEANNQHYLATHWAGRIPLKTLQVECVTLDGILAATDAPDFIKIDTQGAELEILKGAEQTLRLGSPIVLTETWCAEVYTGMPLTHDVMGFMYQMGYQVFDLNVAAAWQHSNSVLPIAHCKAKTIGFDLLFVKRLDQLCFTNECQLLKFAGLCELFGFRDYAMAALEVSTLKSPRTAEAMAIMRHNDEMDRRATRWWRQLFNKFMRRANTLWPSLH